MLINKSCVVINIESKRLRYKIIKSDNQSSATESEAINEYSFQDLNDIELFIIGLQKSIPRYTVFELNFDNTYIQLQPLTIPDVKLKLNEIELFVEASIYKLFQLSAKNVYFDFICSSQQSKQIIVAITERTYIDTWTELFKKYDLSLIFAGRIIENGKINFLPWRQTKQKQHKRQFTVVVTCFIGMISCLFCYLYLQAQTKLEYYSLQLLEKHDIQQKLTRELSNFLPNPSPSQKQIQQSLLLITKQLPTTIWLESLSYIPQKISLKGHSFSYVEMTNFNEQMQKQEKIAKSQIQSIVSNKNNLMFEMDIELSEQ